MTGLPRRTAMALVVALACVLPCGSAQAAPSTDNIATAITEQDGSHVFDFAWNLSRQRDVDVVDNLNSATARAACVHCGATAIAFQIVLVSGSPRVVVPQNVAQAVNVDCTQCVTVAEARQFVRVVPAPVRLTGAGRATLADVRRTLRALEAADLPPDQLDQVVEEQEAKVRQVLEDDLVLTSHPATAVGGPPPRVFQTADVD